MEPAARLSLPARPSLVALAHRFRDQVDERLVAIARPMVRALHAVHPVRFDGLENLPDGPALLVGNHGLLGYETALFFERIYAETGRLPRGCADRWFFRVPLLRDVLVRVGGMYGAPQNADQALSRGELVVCYPGGAREVLKHDPAQRYKLRWEKSRGFAKVALRNRVPIIPFAAAGVDDTYSIVSRLRGSGRLLMGNDKYDLPLLFGRGPFPSPVPFWFRIGKPIEPPVVEDGAPTSTEQVEELHQRAWESAQTLLDDLVCEWRAARERPPASIDEDVTPSRGVVEPACAY
jgi:1-acyl-sn-glycerol-3-phosphate acyltransferase